MFSLAVVFPIVNVGKSTCVVAKHVPDVEFPILNMGNSFLCGS